jgi:hypothetical protein
MKHFFTLLLLITFSNLTAQKIDLTAINSIEDAEKYKEINTDRFIIIDYIATTKDSLNYYKNQLSEKSKTENIKVLEVKLIVAMKVNYIFFYGKTLSKKEIDLNATYGKFKTAISESLLQFDIGRFIKASQTFEKYVDKLPEDIFDEYTHWMQKALTTLTEHIEDRNVIPTENQEIDLVKLFGVWKHEIGRVCMTARALPPEETIF